MPLEFERLSEILARPWVVAAWLFGSAQGGEVRQGGDIDIAVMADPTPCLDEQLDLQADLADATQAEVDLIILNQASSILRFEALQGRSLYCRDPEKRAEFASLAAREYEDDMALCQRGLAAWRERNGQI